MDYNNQKISYIWGEASDLTFYLKQAWNVIADKCHYYIDSVAALSTVKYGVSTILLKTNSLYFI